MGFKNDYKCKIVIAPGGGFTEKCWGDRKFNELTKLLSRDSYYNICIIGSDEDRKEFKSSKVTDLKFLWQIKPQTILSFGFYLRFCCYKFLRLYAFCRSL